MRWIFAILPLVVFGLAGTAYAEPLEEINTEILEYSDNFATVQISWNNDDSVSQYEAGCVSCIPNITGSTENDTIVLQNVTALNSGEALLFIVAYDDASQIVAAKQIIIALS